MDKIIVEQLGWLTQREFIDSIAMGQITPGPILITATFIGYKINGIIGAFVYRVVNTADSMIGYKTDIFKNILFLQTDEPEKNSFSANSGFWFRELKEGNSLNTLKRRILRRKDYELLDHFTWHQGASGIDESPYVYLQSEKYGLYIKTYKSRYLHLDVKAYLENGVNDSGTCLLYTSPSPRDGLLSRMPSSA